MNYGSGVSSSWMNDLIDRHCKHCGETLHGERFDFCSRICRTRYQNAQNNNDVRVLWDRDKMLELYIVRDMSSNQIAKEYGVSSSAVRRWLVTYGIPRKGNGSIGEKNPSYGNYGPLSTNWKGGISDELKAFYYSREWQICATSVLKRDGNKCQRCNNVSKLLAHHILEAKENKSIMLDESNCVTVCCYCHRWIHSQANIHRDYLTLSYVK